jgi:hypothetical protein
LLVAPRRSGVTVGSMSDRLFFPLALAAAVVMIALATVWP